MLVAAAVCPHPPLLVPEVAQGAAAELDLLRDGCRRAVRTLLDASPDLLVLVGGGTATRAHPAGARGSLRGYGVGVDVGLGEPAAERAEPRDASAALPRLPLSLTVAAWLLATTVPAGPTVGTLVGQEVAEDAPPDVCAELGRALATAAPRVALLVAADGTARRGAQAPGYTDPRAVPLDDAVIAALAAGDPAALLAVDPTLAADLLMAGRAALQVLAGAAAGTCWRAAVLATDDRHGVAYTVATWTAVPRASTSPA